MNYQKYIQHLEATFDKSLTFSKEVALKRDNKLIEGFLNKAEEELSFNDFYSNGNENIVKYVAVLNGLEEKNYPFFQEVSIDTLNRLNSINAVAKALIEESDDYKQLYNIFKLGAEYCLYIYIDEMFRYSNLDNRLKFQNIIRKAKKITKHKEITANDKIEFKNLINEGQLIINSIKFLNKKLESLNFTKRNAFYAVKNFYWLHEKGSFDDMTNVEIKAFYFKKVREEIKFKHQLLKEEIATSTTNDKINIFA